VDYDLTKLDHRKFEHLVQATAIKVVAAGVSAFGDGPDNGREATFEGKMDYPSEADPWSGLLVMQAKFRQVPQSNATDSKWALDELRKELKGIFDPGSKRTEPDYYIFATNVTLSSAAGGGKDRAHEIAAEYPLEEFHLWDGDQIRAYLDTLDTVRDSFDALTTPSDVLAELKRTLRGATPDFDRVIARFLERELLADQYANLEQAGKVVEEQVPISRVFVDLPLQDEDLSGHNNFIASTLEVAAERLSPEAGPRPQPAEHVGPLPQRGRIVLIGGPGQGKTTLGQVLCQLFRTSLLGSRPPGSLTPEAGTALELMRSQCEQERIPIPTVPRFPVRIALTDLSDRLADPSGPDSLLEAVAAIVAGRGEERLPTQLFREWLGSHPWLLVLDGLDEVPASGNRAAVLEAIRDFWVDATEAKADLLVLATTRPQGYNDDFSPNTYRHLTLANLGSNEALHYGRRLALARHPTNDEKREHIATELEQSTSRAPTRNLMTTPLQVTIMATLADQGGKLPKQKWKLFSEYYRVICLRELQRGIAASEVLSEHQVDIDKIHRRVGLILQAEGEQTSRAKSRMLKARFGRIAVAQLQTEGQKEPRLNEIATEIVTAATDRLVFLVGLEADWIGFEIRSLQEFMAAEALLDGSEANVTARLEAIAGITSWRNVFLFAAGHCFAERRHLRATFSTLCAHLNDPADDLLAPILRPGSELAVELLDDDVARNQPEYLRQLVREAMGLVECHVDFWQLLSVVDESTEDVCAEELRKGLAEPGATRASCILLLRELAFAGSKWADRLLEERLPTSLESAQETLAWEEESLDSEEERRIQDPWLTRRLDEHAAELSLVEIDASRDVLYDVWDNSAIDALIMELDAFSVHRHGQRIRIPDLDPARFSLSMRWLEGGKRQDLRELLWEIDTTTLGADVLSAALAANAFKLEPTAAELASRLREIADRVDPKEWRTLAKLSTWPMSSSLLHADGDLAALRQIADLAESGSLGDRAEWEAAERRWQEDGLAHEDLGYAPAVDAPFDKRIATHGLPLDESADFAAAYGGQPEIAKAIVDLLEACERAPARRVLTKWLLMVLQRQATVSGEPAPAGPLCVHLSDDSLDTLEQVDYALVIGIEWSAELSPQEAEALDRIGRRLRGPRQGRAYDEIRFEDASVPRAPVAPALIVNWEAGRRSDGLLRILAIGLDRLTDIRITEAPEIFARNPGAAGLLGLKQAKSAEEMVAAAVKIASVGKTEPIWLWEATRTLDEYIHEGRLDRPATERVTALLWEAAVPHAPGEEMLALRRRLGTRASQLFDMRSSDLNDEATWKELGFGDLPRADEPDAAD